MAIHIGVIIVVEIMFTMSVNYMLCSLVASTILIDELIRIKFFKKMGQIFHPSNSIEIYEIDENGIRTSHTESALLFALLAGTFLCIILGYGFAVYFLFVDGARVAFVAYKANKEYNLNINPMPYYIFAFAGSIGIIVLRYFFMLAIGRAA